jgi:hypothetical protein
VRNSEVVVTRTWRGEIGRRARELFDFDRVYEVRRGPEVVGFVGRQFEIQQTPADELASVSTYRWWRSDEAPEEAEAPERRTPTLDAAVAALIESEA